MQDPAALNTERRGIRGQWVVLALILFGVSATAFLWLYTWFDTRPFQPLYHALSAEFDDAVPLQVKGGRPKKGPPTLRIVMRSEFDPHQDEERFSRSVDKVARLAARHQDLSRYELLEIYFEHRVEGEDPTIRGETIRTVELQGDPLP